jgi:hypothetical protein
MLRKLIERIRRRSGRHTWSDASAERVQDARSDERDRVEAETPGHGDRAGQIGIFS